MSRPCSRSPREHHWYGPQTVPFEASNHQQATHPPTDAAAIGELLGPRVILRGTTSALRTGLLQTTTKGHAAQLGGVLIVAPDGSVPYAHLADDAADNPSTGEVLVAARRAATAASRTDT